MIKGNNNPRMVEQWLDINGYEGKYQISNLGRIKIKDKDYILKQQEDKGYKKIQLSINDKKKTYWVHRLVAQTFIPNPNNLPVVNHIDGNKSNNRTDNLEWCTCQYNCHHAINTGLWKTKLGKVKEECPKLSKEELLKLQTITLNNNRWKGIEKNKRDHSKIIGQYDLNGNLIKIWKGVHTIQNECGYASRKNIMRSCNNKTATAYGYKWKLMEDIHGESNNNTKYNS